MRKKIVVFGLAALAGFAIVLQVGFHVINRRSPKVPGRIRIANTDKGAAWARALLDADRPETFSGDDNMEKLSKQLAGVHGFDCGRVPVDGDPKAATRCVLRLQEQGLPFRVRYDRRGVDSATAAGLVRTPLGQMFELGFDGDPAGGGGINAYGGYAKSFPCPLPVRLWVNPKGRVNCIQLRLSPPPPKDIMSPNAESY